MTPRYPIRNGGMRVDTLRVTLQGCSGGCDQGRRACDCELAARHDAAKLDLVVSRPVVRMPVQVSGGRIPRARRMRRTVEAVWAHPRTQYWTRGLLAIAAAAALVYGYSGDLT